MPNSNPVCEPPFDPVTTPCCNVAVPTYLNVTLKNVTGCGVLEGVKLTLKSQDDGGHTWTSIPVGGWPFAGTYVYCGNGGLLISSLLECTSFSNSWSLDIIISPFQSCPVHSGEQSISALYIGTCNPINLEFTGFSFPQSGSPTFNTCNCCASQVITLDAKVGS
ncbi:hypothetical protein Enr17x_04570 [Gimesia fumaroli]|uniref:Uncharacterized protein n=1 Tax=Gimesia fumaroli TaxID=2527976 RepID=A0A518I5W1_9PLAN|nr:hypothetical protein Enr17x_04570 [Gimesia fumaroli]